MLKKLFSACLAGILLCGMICASFAETEGTDLGYGLELLPCRFTCFSADDGTDAMVIMNPVTAGMMYTIFIDGSLIGVTHDELVETMLQKGVNQTSMGSVTIDSDPQTTNETTWVIGTSTIEGTVFDIPVAVNGTMVLMGMAWGLSHEDIAEIMEYIHNTSTVSENAKSDVNSDSPRRVTVDTDTLVGVYDCRSPFNSRLNRSFSIFRHLYLWTFLDTEKRYEDNPGVETLLKMPRPDDR